MAFFQWKTIFSLALLATCGFAVNSVDEPIVTNAAFVHTREFSQIPNEDDGPAKIVCIIPRGRTLFICTLTKIYRVYSDGSVRLFMDVAAAISEATGRSLDVTNLVHGGVRSIAFHPTFRRTGLFYISAMETRPVDSSQHYYLSDVPNPIDADSVLLEFRYRRYRRAVQHSSYREVFRVGMPVYDHTIRQIAFHRHRLYVAHGDGSEQDATVGGGQNNDARGKILRINPRKPRRGSRPYTVPSNNPFVGRTDMLDEVWALGFRNPHHICFGRDGTLYVPDTGRSNVEEVNLVKPGGNYGWSLREGTFIHTGPGLLTGIAPLPADDAKNGFEYPNAQVGHFGDVGDGFKGQAIAGACPVENGSPMAGNYYYADFPRSGRLFFSKINELKAAKTNGSPDELTQATTFEAVICFERTDENGNKFVRRFSNLRGVIRTTPGLERIQRADVRFGRGKRGELYWSSKQNGKIYVMTSSERDGPSSAC